MRNPERLKDFLTVLKKYDGLILTDEIIKKVAIELIKEGKYKPMIVSQEIRRKWRNEILLEDDEAEKAYIDNPQDHEEAGFEWGWPSRFDTWFKIAKEFGFVWYWPNEPIQFSESGNMLLDREKPENELLVFANTFAKYQRHNPFRRILNKNIPLILLIETITLLRNDPEYNGTGISKSEIPLLLCWQNDDAESLYLEIKIKRNMPQTMQEETLIHEAIHAMNFGLPEESVQYLSMAFYQLLKDNDLLR